MTYTEFKNTYKTLLKKYPEISGLYETTLKIGETKIEYEKVGSRWKEISKEENIVDEKHYLNMFDAVSFFRDLGGYERVKMGYTIAGYIPITSISISPDKKKKIVREYSFSR